MKIFYGKVRVFQWRLLIPVLLFSVFGFDYGVSTNSSDHLQELQYCIRKGKQPNLKECIGRSAISFLQRFDEAENVTVTDDIIVTKDERAAGRSLVNILDTDPVDIRGILENAGAVVSQRSFEWHMDRLYPGLMLKIGPSADANSVAEFVLDPTLDDRNFESEDVPTARILTKQYILPLLLGLKFNLAALVPILFAVICLLLKKSLFIAKLVIYISSILGVGGVAGAIGSLGGFGAGFFGAPLKPPHHLHHAAHLPGSFGLYPGKHSLYSQYDEDELQHTSPYKRQDRKVVFDKPRENPVSVANYNIKSSNMVPSTATTFLPSPEMEDHFYDYERQVLMQDRSGKMRHAGGKLGPSTHDGGVEEELGVINTSKSHRFMTGSVNSGWKLVRV